MHKRIILLLSLVFPVVTLAATNIRVDLNQQEYTIYPDKTYRLVEETKQTLLTPYGVTEGQSIQITFDPDRESLKLINAYVILPNGKKILVSKNNYFIRPSSATQEYPGFSNSQVLTITFPQVMPGCQTVIKWQLDKTKPDLFGVNIVNYPTLTQEIKKQVIIVHSSLNTKVFWGKYGAYIVKKTTKNNQRTITATLINHPARIAEERMPDEIDVQPVFVVSTISSWDEIGEIYWRYDNAKAKVTPEITKLAKKIVGNKTGYAAAEALYNWVASNIEYVKIYLNEADGYVPHSAISVLKNGYGDCKDHVVFLQALLKSIGVDSYPVLVNWGHSYRALPIPVMNFNHAMLYIPQFNIFANPTDSYINFGLLDTYSSDKFVVIAAPKSFTSKTPILNVESSTYKSISQMQLNSQGDLIGSKVITATGRAARNIREKMVSAPSYQAVMNSLISASRVAGSGKLSSTYPIDLYHSIMIKSEWKNSYYAKMDKTTYLTVPVGIDFYNILDLTEIATSDIRQFPLNLGKGTFIWEDNITVPSDYIVKNLPQDINLDNFAGNYQVTFKTNNNRIQIIRKLIIKHSQYSPDQYPTIRTLLQYLASYPRDIIVISKTD